MLASIFLVLTAVLYIAVPVLMVLGRRAETDAREDQFMRAAALAGIVAAVLTAATNLLVVLGPEVKTSPRGLLFLIVLAVAFPLVTVLGGVFMLLRRDIGPVLMIVGMLLWFSIALLGFIGSVTNFSG